MDIIESIIQDLHELPKSKLVEVACFVHSLNLKGQERRRAALEATFGCLAGQEGEDFERAVMEHRRRPVNPATFVEPAST